MIFTEFVPVNKLTGIKRPVFASADSYA